MPYQKSTLMLLFRCEYMYGVFGDDMTVKVGDSVVLKTDIQKKQDESMLWYFEGTRMALINKDQSTSCKYDGKGGRFKDRLEVDYETAFLTITDIRLEHAGCYEAEIIRSDSSGKSQSLNRNHAKCDSTKIISKNNLGDTIKKVSVNVKDKTKEESYTDPTTEKTALSDQVKTDEEPRMEKREFDLDSGLSSAAVAGICAAVLLLVSVVAAAGGIYYCRRSSRNAIRKNKNNEGLLCKDQKEKDYPKSVIIK